ncbi:EAL domain-containing protein [Microvirga sp. SYSU G3D207]|uniref:EAL domain-containing protein n=2 Tax=Microvirga arsenatis TaxID=2692265 RepID=A0ABW9YVM1_9HYPH|nr:EAL domain-containing protein [Microvirga arsenatis]NBJ24412.1 EAL domain-containing protein [Microvirga arsenatis]
MRKYVIRKSNIPAAIAFIVVAAAAHYIDTRNKLYFEQSQRALAFEQMSSVRAKLEANIYSNFQLVRGLIPVIATEPNMDQTRFAQLADGLLKEGRQLRGIAAAPGLVISLMHPIKGNESAIGLDYRKNEKQREAALYAEHTGTAVLAGPVELVQGGQGLIARFPVFAPNDTSGKKFWGLVSAVIDIEKLYEASGLRDPKLSIDIALVGVDGNGSSGEHFFGPSEILAANPVASDVTLPSGSWMIAAIPKQGWRVEPDNVLELRMAIFVAGMLIVVPIWITGRLVDERQRHIRVLSHREKQVAGISQRLGLALDSSKIGIWEWDIETNTFHLDDRMSEMFNLHPESKQVPLGFWMEAVHKDDRQRFEAELSNAAASRGRVNSNCRILIAGEIARHLRVMGAVYSEPDQKLRMIGVAWDVSTDVALNENLRQAKAIAEARQAELEAARSRIEYNALHDPLTKMPNRWYLDNILEKIAASGTESSEWIALLHIDLDRFKQINDTLGHPAGDAMLIHAAKVIEAKLRQGDFAARTGGDEFVIVRVSENEPEHISAFATTIIEEMRRPVFYERHECRFGASIGIAIEPVKRFNPQRLLMNADIALYRAKSLGRHRFEMFTEALHSEIVRTKRIADEILSGLEKNEFIPFFQPQFNARTLEVVGLEALVRWDHPVLGILPPSYFLTVAEDLNVVDAIDHSILKQVLAQLKEWDRSGMRIAKTSVNVSSKRIHDESLILQLQALDIPSNRISFELVESTYLDENDDVVVRNIERIKELGIDIEIDDFGTGYASIVSLLKIKPRRLKIDRQLVSPIVSSPVQKRLVRSIIDIGHSLNIEIVAEGVETMQHAELLGTFGCHVLQGHAFAPAMSAEAVERLYVDHGRPEVRSMLTTGRI